MKKKIQPVSQQVDMLFTKIMVFLIKRLKKS